MCPLVSLALPRPFPLYAAFPRSEYRMGESDFHHRVRVPMDGPFSSRTQLNSRSAKTRVDLSGPSMLPFPSVPCSQTPPQSPAPVAFSGSLLLPSRFSTLSACGYGYNEAQSLHLRYGLLIALPTLNSCRYLHESKARFSVGRLIPLAEAGISPAGSIRLHLTHRKISPNRCPPPSAFPHGCNPVLCGPPDALRGPDGSQSLSPRT
jgi:hypothetical protein